MDLAHLIIWIIRIFLTVMDLVNQRKSSATESVCQDALDLQTVMVFALFSRKSLCAAQNALDSISPAIAIVKKAQNLGKVNF